MCSYLHDEQTAPSLEERDPCLLIQSRERADLTQQSGSPTHVFGCPLQVVIVTECVTFDCSAEDRREYLESLLRESKKEEVALVLDDEALNDLLARRFAASSCICSFIGDSFTDQICSDQNLIECADTLLFLQWIQFLVYGVEATSSIAAWHSSCNVQD